MDDKQLDEVVAGDLQQVDELQLGTGEIVNASGHTQELDRRFNLLSAAAVGVTTGTTWPALGGAIVVALYDGGAPGVIFEYIAVSILYAFVYASIAELASAIPSSAGVYHFASVTAGRYSRPVSFWAGWWNFFAWIFACAATAAIAANIAVSMWAVFHPAYEYQRWHVYVVYLIETWFCAGTVMYANSFLPIINRLAMIMVVAGGLVTILVCAIMPKTTGSGYATNFDVWRNWQNQTGWRSNGFVFCIGMLNGAYAVGTADICTHISEEIPNPRRNVPRAMCAQFLVGFFTAMPYSIALFYTIHDLDAVFNTNYNLPIAEAYQQATNSRGGALGLLILIYIPQLSPTFGTFITAGRILWTLSRDNATPCHVWLSKIHTRYHCPFNATFVCACIATALGAIYIGSSAAFNALVGSFVILTTLSYIAAILPHLIGGRRRVVPGPFWMPGAWGIAVHSVSCAFIAAFVVIFCFPYTMPVAADNMNYSSLITGGLSIFIGILWLWKRNHGYEGPHVLVEHREYS